jgi:hypothetical protein
MNAQKTLLAGLSALVTACTPPQVVPIRSDPMTTYYAHPRGETFSVVLTRKDSAGTHVDTVRNVRSYGHATWGGVFLYFDTTTSSGAYKQHYDWKVKVLKQP